MAREQLVGPHETGNHKASTRKTGSRETDNNEPRKRDKSTRERILDEALALFAQRGFEATSVHDIASEVGIKAPSLYKHFAGKQAIFDAIVDRALEDHLAAAARLGAPKVGEGAAQEYARANEETMVRITTGLLEHWTTGNASLFRRMLSAERLRSPQMAKLYRELFLDGPHVYQTALFGQMLEDGAFRPADPAQLALQFWAPILFIMERSDCDVDPVELKSQAQKHILSFMEQWKADGTDKAGIND